MYDKNEHPYLTPEELVERYKGQISLRTLANWRCTGEGPPFTKIGGRVLYLRVAVYEWEASRVVGVDREKALKRRLDESPESG